MKTILITGATSGIGLAAAKKLAKSKNQLILCGRRQRKLDEISSELSKTSNILSLCFDVSEKNEVTKLLDNLPEGFSSIDILINNAGNAHGMDTIQDGSLEDWDNMIDSNVKGLLYVSRIIIPKMIEKQSGHIINIGSIAGLYPVSSSVYGGSKGAVHMINQNLRVELSGTGVRATEICPGRVNTEFFDVAFSDNPDKRKQMTSGLKLLEQEDVADAIMFAINAPWRMNVSMIELTPTEQVPGGSIIKEAK